MPSLDIWFTLHVGQHDFAGAGQHRIAANEIGKINLHTNEPMTKINYPAIRSELHDLLDDALDRIQSNHPNGEPYVK